MDRRLADRVETHVDRAASVILAGAVGYAVYGVTASTAMPLVVGAGMLFSAVAAFAVCGRMLRANADRSLAFAVPIFDIRQLEPEELLRTQGHRRDGELFLTEAHRVDRELVLTDADRLRVEDEPLLLDDVLAAMGPGSRVVRLFDQNAMPTPEQLRNRIAAHVDGREGNGESPDAAQQLSEALAELRQALR